jgi:hypothetical protein
VIQALRTGPITSVELDRAGKDLESVLIIEEELTLLQTQQDLVAIRPKRGIAPMRQRELIPIRTQDLTEIGKFCN